MIRLHRAAQDEVQDLQRGMDFRLPQYRREVFLRFFQFHLRYRAHPGAVYYVLPGLAQQAGWDMEQRLWFAYLNGNTQNPVTSWLIFQQFPSLQDLDLRQLRTWITAHYDKLQFDTDRRYYKKSFLQAVEQYRLLVGSSQEQFFEFWASRSGRSRFANLWAVVSKEFYGFGRLSTYSYLEYLSIMGLPLVCDNLFLRDLAGSRSHRNGLCKVLGRDDLDWHASNPAFDGQYPPPVLSWLEREAAQLLEEARSRQPEADLFTMESALCTYKSWHRPNRRYPNVYNDMFHDRIRAAERAWGRSLPVFWELRRQALPPPLRLEDNPQDPGCVPVKQNHYLRTGQVIVMDLDWPCFQNDFGRSV